MTILVGISISIYIAFLICAIYGLTQVMLSAAHLRGYLEALQHERRDPDSAPRVGGSE